jgi:hypothetical protein
VISIPQIWDFIASVCVAAVNKKIGGRTVDSAAAVVGQDVPVKLIP